MIDMVNNQLFNEEMKSIKKLNENNLIVDIPSYEKTIIKLTKKVTKLEKENSKSKEIIKLLLWDLRNKNFESAKDIEKAETFLGR